MTQNEGRKKGVPTPPDYIAALPDVVKLYKEIFRFLQDKNAVASIDKYYIADAAHCRWRLNEIIRVVGETTTPTVKEFDSGSIQITGYLTELQMERKMWGEYCLNLGLNVMGRGKLAKLFTGSKENDIPDFMDEIGKMKKDPKKAK
jgi:hypothetical protein